MAIAIQLGTFIVLILLGLVVGRATESNHLRSLAHRESPLSGMLVTDLKTFPGGADPARGGAMVMGEAVIATDYLKSFLARLRNLFGGEMRSYETLMSRARREAMVRMLQQARGLGHNAVCNVRYGTADIAGVTGKRPAAMVESFVSGTAYSVSRGTVR